MIYAEIEDNLAEMYICCKTKILLSVLQLLVLHREIQGSNVHVYIVLLLMDRENNYLLFFYPFRDLLKYRSKRSHSRGLFNSMKYQTGPGINWNFIYRKL